MTIKELEKESETYAFYVAEAHMHMYAIDKSPIAEGYIQGFIKALQILAERLDAKGISAQLVMGHDLSELANSLGS